MIYLRNKINKPRTCKGSLSQVKDRKWLDGFSVKKKNKKKKPPLSLHRFPKPHPQQKITEEKAPGKVAKVHFSGNKTKNPIVSASSWHPFLTLPNQVTHKAWGMSGPTHILLVHQRATPSNPSMDLPRGIQLPWLGAPATPEGRNLSDTWHSLFQQTTVQGFPNSGPNLFEDQEAGAFLGQK